MFNSMMAWMDRTAMALALVLAAVPVLALFANNLTA
jgi:acyl-CoA hydrolase